MRGRLGRGEVRRVQDGHLLIVVLERLDEVVLRLVEENAWTVQQEPGDGQEEDGGDVDRLAEAGAFALVVEGVDEVDDLVGFEFAEATGAKFDGLVRRVAGRGRVGRKFKNGHRQSMGRLRAEKVPGVPWLNPERVRWFSTLALFSHPGSASLRAKPRGGREASPNVSKSSHPGQA